LAPRYFDAYPASNDEEASEASEAAFRDIIFAWQNWMWVRMQAKTGKAEDFYYFWNKTPPFPPGAAFAEQNPATKLRAYHGSEILYVFHHLDVKPWPWTNADRKLSDMMASYWVNFARTGNPNGEGLPRWPAFNSERPGVMMLGDAIAPGPIPNQKQLDFWDVWFAKARAE
jgi:para-nitrobenzyl esterase